MSATTLERSIAEHADRQHPRPASSSGQRRGFVSRDVAGAARHEDEAGECRRPGGANIGAAIQSAQLGAAEDELARRLRRVARAHQRRADQEASTSGASRSTSPRAAMPDSETSSRSGAMAASRSVVARSMREVAQVAVVDADQRRTERKRAAHLGFVMHLDQRVHAEAPRLVDHLRPRPSSSSSDSMTRIASAPAIRASTTWRGSMKKSLARIGPSNSAARGRQIVERAAEILRVASAR